MATEKLRGRIRYVEDWHDRGEHYVFEIKRPASSEWDVDTAFKLFDNGEDKGVLLSYQALTKIREWMRMGIQFDFTN